MTESLSQKQKVKQKTNIKININLAEKKKRRKQRRKKRMGNNEALQRAQRAQQILFSQSTTIPRTVEQQNSGMIMDNFRNQQQQLNKHSSLINTGISQLNFLNNQLRNYQPLNTSNQSTTQPTTSSNLGDVVDEIIAQQPEPEPEEEEQQQPTQVKGEPSINYGRIAKMAGWNQKASTLSRVKEIYENYFKDLTDKEIEDEYATEFGDRKFHGNTKTREGKIGKLIGARFENVTTERGGGGSALFSPPIEPPSLSDQIQEEPAPDIMTTLYGEED